MTSIRLPRTPAPDCRPPEPAVQVLDVADGPVRSISLIQADRDRELEVMVASSNGLFRAELLKPGLRLEAPRDPGRPRPRASEVKATDLDRDGVEDLIISQGERFEVYLGQPVRSSTP